MYLGQLCQFKTVPKKHKDNNNKTCLMYLGQLCQFKTVPKKHKDNNNKTKRFKAPLFLPFLYPFVVSPIAQSSAPKSYWSIQFRFSNPPHCIWNPTTWKSI